MPAKDPAAAPDDTAAPLKAPDVGQPTAQVFEDPVAGGNYVRDPVTGALSLNPAFANTATPIPQE